MEITLQWIESSGEKKKLHKLALSSKKRDGTLLYKKPEAVSVSPETKSLFLKQTIEVSNLSTELPLLKAIFNWKGAEEVFLRCRPVHPPVQGQIKYFT